MYIYQIPYGADVIPYVTRLYASVICTLCNEPLNDTIYGMNTVYWERRNQCDLVLDATIPNGLVVTRVDVYNDLSYFEACSRQMEECFLEAEQNNQTLSKSCNRYLQNGRSVLNEQGTGIDLFGVA